MSDPNAGIKVSIVLGKSLEGGDMAQWLCYAAARAKFIQENPGRYAGCRGRVTSTYGEELEGRLMYSEGFERGLAEAGNAGSVYLRDLWRVRAAGYMAQYTWWFLNHPSWPFEEQPEGLLNFIRWAVRNLQGHVVETCAGVTIQSGDEREELAEMTGTGSASVDIQMMGGAEFRGVVTWMQESMKRREFEELLAATADLVAKVEAMKSEADVRYLTFRRDQELQFHIARNPDIRVLRVLDWGVAEALFLRSFALVSMGRLGDGANLLRYLVELAPTYGRAYSELGYILNRLRMPREARPLYLEAFYLGLRLPMNGECLGATLRGLAYIEVEFGEFESAKAMLRDSLILEPDNPVALRELKYIEEQGR